MTLIRFTKDGVDLQAYTDEQLFTEVLRRGYDEHEAYGAIVQLVENHCAKSDIIWGSSEAGQHGKAMGEASRVKPALPLTANKAHSNAGLGMTVSQIKGIK